MIRIKPITKILNGQTISGEKATYASAFKSARYAIILFAGTTLEIFGEQTVRVGEYVYFNFYRLQKVASVLHLDFDRSKIAKKIYTELQSQGYVVIIKEENKTFIALTEYGKKNCLTKLQEFCDLYQLFFAKALLNEKFQEIQNKNIGLREKSPARKSSQEELLADDLVKRISTW